MYTYNMPSKINTNFADINKFITIYNKIDTIQDEEIMFDFRDTEWLSGEMAALFGVICNKLQEGGHRLSVKCLDNIMEILQGNNFAKLINESKENNIKSTAILYKEFEHDLKSLKYDCFDQYIRAELESKVELGKEDVNYIVAYLSEIFVNARTHGNTNKIFCCGQKYPNLKKIKILLVDLGVGIPYNVRKKIAYEKDYECIEWSLEKGNSTKQGLGGLGLYEIFDFIKKHNGNISIISLNGQYNYKEQIRTDSNNRFDGTIIHIEFDYTMLNSKRLFERNKKKNYIFRF